jgi:hypothetical protein
VWEITSGILTWLFADSPKGATATGILYTLAESARVNELDVFSYLNYLLTEIPNSDYLKNPELLDRYLPWSPDLPDHCRLNYKFEKCLNK